MVTQAIVGLAFDKAKIHILTHISACRQGPLRINAYLCVMEKGARTMTALYHTLGCKLNYAETSTVGRLMAERGIMPATAGTEPDIIVVNTCTVTEVADTKSRRAIAALHRRHPGARILVTGCYAQLRATEAASLPGVALVAGNNDKLRLAQWIDGVVEAPEVKDARDFVDFMPSCARGDRTRYWLKVQDGCDRWCSYCAIPRARGRSRSGTIDQLVAQAADAAAHGGREIVITGVNIGDWGRTRGESLIDLLRALDKVDGVERYRISSLEPDLITNEIIDMVASSRRFMPHWHIPLQCGSDAVLALMRRRYDTAQFAERVRAIRQRQPQAFIGVDLIVGMRGETAELFEESRRYVEGLPVTRLHVFPYSERAHTRALEIEPSVPAAEKARRARIMGDISLAKHAAMAASMVGQTRPVLIERGRPGQPMAGHTDNYMHVTVTDATHAMDNSVLPVTITAYNAADASLTGLLA